MQANRNRQTDQAWPVPALLMGLLLTLGLGGMVLAQDTEQESEPAPSAETDGEQLSEDDGEEAAEAAPEGEAAEADAVTDASMARFRPSEEISSDRSVAFPNDI